MLPSGTRATLMAISTGISVPSARSGAGLDQPPTIVAAAVLELLQPAMVRLAKRSGMISSSGRPSTSSRPVAEDPLGGRVELDDAAVAVHADHAVEGRVDGGAQARLAAQQCALALAPFADVAHDRQCVRLAALRERHHPQVDVEPAAVGPQASVSTCTVSPAIARRTISSRSRT